MFAYFPAKSGFDFLGYRIKFGVRRAGARLWSDSRTGTGFSVAMAGLLVYILVESLVCGDGVMGCSMRSFGVIFPLHLLLSGFNQSINLLLYFAYYAIAAVMYVYTAFQIGSWAERAVSKFLGTKKEI